MTGSAPKAPDPNTTAAAQTATNVATQQANAAVQNVNQVTPYGSLSYDVTGHQFISDPNGQKYYTDGTNYSATPQDGYNPVKGEYVNSYTATQTLSPAQQAILEQQNGASLNMATLANTQSGKLNDLLNTNLNLSNAPAAGTAGNYTQYGAAPALATTFGDAGKITNTIANAGQIQNTLGDAGAITKSYDTDYSKNVQQVQDALMARLQPQLDKSRSSLDATLANQGISLGSSAYKNAQNIQGQNENDAHMAAILNAGQEQSRLAGLAQNQAQFQNQAQAQQYGQLLNTGQFSNSAQAQQYGQNSNDATFANSAQGQNYDQLLGRANFANSAAQQNFGNDMAVTQGNNAINTQTFNEQNANRAQYLNEAYAARSQPINEISSLLSGAQIQNPNFVNTTQASIPTVDYAGLVQQNYANQTAAYNQQQQSLGGLLGGVGSVASLIKFSDKRLKKDIEPVGKLLDMNLYSYRYKNQSDEEPKQVGVMAQEIQKTNPDAVIKGDDGFLRVHYGRLLDKKAA